MSENLHDIDKLFRDSLEGHEEMPSDKVWDALDNNLDKNNVIHIRRKYNNLKRIAIALLLLLLGTIVYEIQSKKTGQQEVVSNGGSNNNEQHNNTSIVKEQSNSSDKTSTNKNGNSSASASSTSDSRTVNSAGKDSGSDKENTTTQNAAATTPAQNQSQKAGEKTTTVSGKDRLKVNIKAPASEEDNDIANENTVTPQGNKFYAKKSSGHKTNVRIKNAVATEDGDENTASENTNLKKGNDQKLNSASANELRALQSDAIKTIPERLQVTTVNTINANRISPDAAMTNTIAKKSNSKNYTGFHFNVMPFYAPQYSFNRLEDDRRDPGPQPRNGREQIKEQEPNEKSAFAGVMIEIPVSKKWGLQTGITVLNKSISIEPKKIFAKLDNDGKVKYRFDCSSGYTYISPKVGTSPVVGDSVIAAGSTNTLQYIGIPLAINYTFSIGKFSVIPTLGTTLNFLSKQKIETELVQGTSAEKQTISNIQGLKKTYANFFTGVALEYNISKKIAVDIMPVGNFALSSINKDAAVKSYPNSFGISGGIKIKF